MENDLVVIKIHKDDRKRLKVLGAEWGATLPDTIQIILDEWGVAEATREKAEKKAEVNSYIVERNKADLEELMQDPPYICKQCGRNYKEDKSEPYCEHVKFTGNAYFLDKYFIRGATMEETKEYNERRWKEKYGK